MKRLPDTSYVLRDYHSSEIRAIVSSVSRKESEYQRKKTRILAELLDSHWEGQHRNQLEALIYDSKNETYLEANTASSFSKFLVHQPWLPPKFDSDGVLRYYEDDNGDSPALYKGSKLFDPRSHDVERLLHHHVPYIDANLRCSEFIKHLKIQDSVTKRDLLERLICWSETSQQHGTKFCTSIKHMSAVYQYLLGGGTYQRHQDHGYDDKIDTIKEHFTDDSVPLIFVPKRYVEEGNRMCLDDVDGDFFSIHRVCWIDPTSVLYNKQKYNKNLPGALPRILSLYYDRSEHLNLKGIFESVNIRCTPNIGSLIAGLKYNSSLSANPDRDTVRDFTSVALYLVDACREQNLGDSYLLTHLRNAKVFPSHKNVWVNLSDHCLLENDSTTMEKFFGETETVHFLQWPAQLTVEKKKTYFGELQQISTMDKREEFLRVLNIPTLSTKVCVLIDPGVISQSMEDLKEKLCLCLPILQQFLQQKCSIQYAKLVSDEVNIAGKLLRLQILVASDLKCQHYIDHEGERLMSPKPVQKPCELDFASGMPVIYVAEKKRGKNPGYLCDPLLKLFMSDNSNEAEERSFQTFLKELFLDLPSTQEEVGEFSKEHQLSAIKEEDGIWVIPLPLRSNIFVEEVVKDEILMQDNQIYHPLSPSAATGEEDSEEPKLLKSWPPRAAVDRTTGNNRSQAPSGLLDEQRSKLTSDDVIGMDDIREVRKKYIEDDDQEDENTERSGQTGLASQLKERRKINYGTDTERGEYTPTDGKCSAFENASSNPIPKRDGHPCHPSKTTELSPQTCAESANNLDEGRDGGSGGRQGSKDFLGQSREHMGKTSSWQAMISAAHDLSDVSGGGGACLVDIQHVVDQLHDRKSLPLPLVDHSDEQDQESFVRIGRWGEEHVYTVLRASGELPNGRKIDSIVWVNEMEESGKPYDIEVMVERGDAGGRGVDGGTGGGGDGKEGEISNVPGDGDGEEEPKTKVFIEVKSTVAHEKAIVEISLNELNFAVLKSCDYHMYRVYGAGLPSSRLCLLENLHQFLKQKSAQLLFYL